MLSTLSSITSVPYAKLANEAKSVFAEYGSTEYPFVAQELPSIVEFYNFDIDRMLEECVLPAREAFLRSAEPFLVTYPGVIKTLQTIKESHPEIPIAALTDAPRYVAMWKLNKLKILHYFDAVYGLGDPRIPICRKTKKIKVQPDLLLKHLERKDFGFRGKIRVLPDDYEKPGTKGFKTVLIDYDLDEQPELRASVLWIGDNQRKDIALGNKVGVTTCWARYGTRIDPRIMDVLNAFSPPQSIAKNAALRPTEQLNITAHYTIDSFEEILNS